MTCSKCKCRNCTWPIEGRKFNLGRFIWELFTGEWWFWCGRPNGGTVIFWRTVQITVIFSAIALAARSYLVAGCAAVPCDFDWRPLFHDDHAETVPWLGAIFGAVWVALYARYSAQWSYLAGVINQMRQTLASRPDPSDENVQHLCLWRAGFIEDCLDLHLATKPMFGPFLQRLLEDEEHRAVVRTFDTYTNEGPPRREWLHNQLTERFGEYKAPDRG
jgi:hypothetical protein